MSRVIELEPVDPDEEVPPALGVVLDAERGTLPFALVHGEPLVAAAAWALGQAGVELLDLGTPWSAIVGSGEPLVLHDALCPLAPPSFLAACVRAALERDAVVLAVRPVTDTVAEVDAEDALVGPLDREQLLAPASPVVVPPTVLERLPDPGPLDGLDAAAWVGALADHVPVVVVRAPATARRVADLDDVRLLEATDPRS